MFKNFKKAVQEKFQQILRESDKLFLTNISKDTIWDTYLSSYPKGTNEIYRERGEHDCNSCKQFLRPFGNVVGIVDNKIVSIWDIEVEEPYQTVANQLKDLVLSSGIKDVLALESQNMGIDRNREDKDGTIKVWEHFFLLAPKSFVVTNSSIAEFQGNHRTTKQVYKRGLDEITIDALETTLDLIAQGSIYRGDEFKEGVREFLVRKKEYDAVTDELKDNYAWATYANAIQVARIRNNAIGTLLTDLSEGKDLEHAVRAFESVMAPSNYKRPKALITKKMKEEAEVTVTELGYMESLARRNAVMDDITVNNVLFVDRETASKAESNMFDSIMSDVKTTDKSYKAVETVPIDTFIDDILPNISSMEVLLQNSHEPNLVSLIAPVNEGAKSPFKWNNAFSWAYNGNLADSIKERVKRAGGKIDADVRISLSWFNYDDLDLHVIEPGGHKIWYSAKNSRTTGGNLDVDMNAGTGRTREAVENIVWSDKDKMREGEYIINVNNFSKREHIDFGFEIEVEIDGQIHNFMHKESLANGDTKTAIVMNFSHKEGFTLTSDLKKESHSKEIWNMNTNSFHKVNMMMFSPNFWDEQQIGNKHYMFMLRDAVNSESPRGFFNEFLHNDLAKHKRVFEALGSRMIVPKSDEQLSGVGFSSTQKNNLIVRLEGKFKRVIELSFNGGDKNFTKSKALESLINN